MTSSPAKTGLSIEKQQQLYDTLKRIGREYMTPAQIKRDAERGSLGLDYAEYLEMSYENIQVLAARAIRGLRRPKAASNNRPEA